MANVKTATKKTAAKTSIRTKAVAKKLAAKISVTKTSGVKKPTAKKPAVKKPVAKKPAVKTNATKPPARKKTTPANNKTQETSGSVDAFLASVTDAVKQADARAIIRLMQQATGHAPKMWGGAIIGFGNRKLVYESGREMDWMTIGFSPRKANLALYITGAKDAADLLAKLGKHSFGTGCLYISKLADINTAVLSELIKRSLGANKA